MESFPLTSHLSPLSKQTTNNQQPLPDDISIVNLLAWQHSGQFQAKKVDKTRFMSSTRAKLVE